MIPRPQLRSDRYLLGVVVDNEDPDMLRRVRVRIAALHLDTPDEHLPWADCLLHGLAGNGAGHGSYAIPEVGDFVWTDTSDPMRPIVVGSIMKESGKLGLFETNYPRRYGTQDSKGNHFFVDRETDDVEIHHVSGTKVVIAPDGEVTVTTVSHINFNVTGNANVVASQKAYVQAPDIELEGETVVTGNLTVTEDLTVEQDTTVQGKTTVDGDLKANAKLNVTGQTTLLSTTINGVNQTGS